MFAGADVIVPSDIVSVNTSRLDRRQGRWSGWSARIDSVATPVAALYAVTVSVPCAPVKLDPRGCAISNGIAVDRHARNVVKPVGIRQRERADRKLAVAGRSRAVRKTRLQHLVVGVAGLPVSTVTVGVSFAPVIVIVSVAVSVSPSASCIV